MYRPIGGTLVTVLNYGKRKQTAIDFKTGRSFSKYLVPIFSIDPNLNWLEAAPIFALVCAAQHRVRSIH
jgi:hypothetical protein